jgi:hypothetical protein
VGEQIVKNRDVIVVHGIVRTGGSLFGGFTAGRGKTKAGPSSNAARWAGLSCYLRYRIEGVL